MRKHLKLMSKAYYARRVGCSRDIFLDCHFSSLNKKVIGCLWIYKVKQKYDGNIERYKARWVSNGYTHVS